VIVLKGALAMEEFLRTPGAITVGVVGVFVCIDLIAVGCTVAVQWRKARQAELEASLKAEMLQQGKSADEIVKVLGATAMASPAELEMALRNKMLNLSRWHWHRLHKLRSLTSTCGVSPDRLR
jgi:hypothetical protein